jgi:hypothetical protein
MAASPTKVRVDDHTMWVALSDGRTLGVPLAWFPRVLHATPEQRERVELSRLGLHWEELDEDISIEGLLAGDRARRNVPYKATPEELEAIDRGLRDAAEGKFATDEEVEAVFAKFRRNQH